MEANLFFIQEMSTLVKMLSAPLTPLLEGRGRIYTLNMISLKLRKMESLS